ncbi:MAG: hypothetical protein N2Z74_03355, partial [Syntrophales bacterium]|nr:hypothetical protein [Syntrophales bacterium]
RESNYFYSPVGLEVAWTTSPDWSLGLYGEYDVFWGGQQKSYLSDVNAGYNDVENRQGSGYGLKGGFFVRRHFDNLYALILEPYVHYWDVSRSDVSIVTYRGKPVTYGVEPDNNTLEVGLKLGLFF